MGLQLPTPLAVFKGPVSKGREGKRKGRGGWRGRERRKCEMCEV